MCSHYSVIMRLVFLLSVLNEVVSAGSYPHDVKTQSGLTEIYNEIVVRADHMKRPTASSGGSKFGVPHEGTRLTTSSGNQYLVHKGPNFGKSSNAVVVDAKHMSGNWQVKDSTQVSNGMTVGNAVQAGGSSMYFPGLNDCRHAAGRIMHEANQK